ncbi:MAG: indole-3-glycerol phosphate synthase TrpC [Planctomycetota bacterium]
MNSILQKIVDHKLVEIEQLKASISREDLESQVKDAPPVRSFRDALAGEGISLIAEVKKQSPSKGLIREDFDPVSIAHSYQAGGAHCVSVLTDEHFFGGSLDYLVQIKRAIDLPVLRKDFVLDEHQVLQARAAGADAVLLIAECLSPDRLKQLYDQVVSLGMTALVELYEAENIEAVLNCNPVLVGINNRDLKTFEVDLQHTVRMRSRVPEEILLVGESGIFTHQEATLLQRSGVDAMLVGESLMRADDPAEAVRQLLGTSA